jgi:hypothetical protein
MPSLSLPSSSGLIPYPRAQRPRVPQRRHGVLVGSRPPQELSQIPFRHRPRVERRHSRQDRRPDDGMSSSAPPLQSPSAPAVQRPAASPNVKHGRALDPPHAQEHGVPLRLPRHARPPPPSQVPVIPPAPRALQQHPQRSERQPG